MVSAEPPKNSAFNQAIIWEEPGRFPGKPGPVRMSIVCVQNTSYGECVNNAVTDKQLLGVKQRAVC